MYATLDFTGKHIEQLAVKNQEFRHDNFVTIKINGLELNIDEEPARELLELLSKALPEQIKKTA